MIEPRYFGPPQASLFGCYHAPQTPMTRDYGIVLCYPMGHEYIRCHRAYRLLATRLAAAGYPVLRFDYYGSGDSPGDSEQARLDRWLNDITAATEHLQRRCDAAKICLVGLRLGGTLALIAGTRRGSYDRMVLWQPVVNGRTYLEELRTVHAAYQESMGVTPRHPQGAGDGREDGEVLGFSYSDSLLADIEKVDLLNVGRKPAISVLLIDNAEEATEVRLKTHLESLTVRTDYQHLPDLQIWLAEPYKALLPHESLKAIVSWLSAARE
jgi:exosortase A-associated hydrolase 2